VAAAVGAYPSPAGGLMIALSGGLLTGRPTRPRPHPLLAQGRVEIKRQGCRA